MIFFSVSFPISAKIAIFLCLTSRGYRSFCSSRRQSAKKHNCDSLLFPGQYDGIGYWQNLKNRSGTKNPDRNLPDFFNRQMAFNPLHLNHLQQVHCCCWCKVKNSESKSQLNGCTAALYLIVVAGVKLKILKANHNHGALTGGSEIIVVAGVKLKILKANHNRGRVYYVDFAIVVAGVKLKILKANHNIIL